MPRPLPPSLLNALRHRARLQPAAGVAQGRADAVPEWQGHWQWRVRAALVWLLMALVLVPSLGRMHEVVHGEGSRHLFVHNPVAAGGGVASDAGPAGASGNAGDAGGAQRAIAAPFHAHGSGGLADLLGSHAGADCLLLDQLSLGAALATAVLAPATVALSFSHGLFQSVPWPARHVVHAWPRGPPQA